MFTAHRQKHSIPIELLDRENDYTYAYISSLYTLHNEYVSNRNWSKNMVDEDARCSLQIPISITIYVRDSNPAMMLFILFMHS